MKRWLLSTLLVTVAGLGGCQADYAADVVNGTPQPIRASIFRKGPGEAVLGAGRRLGPGDRGMLGPVRTGKNYGAFLTVDREGNPAPPLSMELPQGTSYLVVEQDGEGAGAALRIREKR